MDANSLPQNTDWYLIILSVATFFIGLFWGQSMADLIPNKVRIWIFAFFIGLAIFSIFMTDTIQPYLNKWPSSSLYMIIVLALSLIILVIIGLVLHKQNTKYMGKEELRKDISALIKDISEWNNCREMARPGISAEIWKDQQSIQAANIANFEYDRHTNIQCATEYRGRIIDIAQRMFNLKIISKSEFDQMVMFPPSAFPFVTMYTQYLTHWGARLK